MKVAVVTFPGSNCDEDALTVCRHQLQAEAVSVWHADRELPAETDLVVLPGGFSYGDALRSGAIARFAPIMGAVKAHAERGGWVLGICNGFQILVESGLLPGAMLQNASTKFVCKVVDLEVATTASAFTSAYSTGQVLKVPVAHHEGRYFVDDAMLARLKEEDRIIFRYTEATAPNGAVDRIAGVLGEGRNVFGLMPPPERAAEAALGSIDGLGVFTSVAAAVAEGRA